MSLEHFYSFYNSFETVQKRTTYDSLAFFAEGAYVTLNILYK